MRTVESDIVIDDTPARVWDVLTDFAAYPAWSTFIARIEGSAEVGVRLTVRLQPPGGLGISRSNRPCSTRTASATSDGAPARSRPVHGSHEFVLAGVASVNGPERERTHLVQRETFTGALVPLFTRTLERTALGFDESNQALQARTQGRAAHA